MKRLVRLSQSRGQTSLAAADGNGDALGCVDGDDNDSDSGGYNDPLETALKRKKLKAMMSRLQTLNDRLPRNAKNRK